MNTRPRYAGPPMDVQPVRLPPQFRIKGLRMQIEQAERHGSNSVLLTADHVVSLDYARHVLACLEESQPDNVSERENTCA